MTIPPKPRPRGSALVDRILTAGLYIACAMFGLNFFAHIYFFNARPRVESQAQGFTAPERLQVFSAPETIFLRPWEAAALDFTTLAASFLLLIGVLGYYRSRRRKREESR